MPSLPPAASALLVADRVITFVRVERPQLDLVKLILDSVALTIVLAMIALLLGGLIGLRLIRKRRRQRDAPSLQLDLRPTPTAPPGPPPGTASS